MQTASRSVRSRPAAAPKPAGATRHATKIAKGFMGQVSRLENEGHARRVDFTSYRHRSLTRVCASPIFVDHGLPEKPAACLQFAPRSAKQYHAHKIVRSTADRPLRSRGAHVGIPASGTEMTTPL